jgi:hypothetical protein
MINGKAHGARVLHGLTRDLCLDFFVIYSASWLLRRAAVLPALSVAWGMWSDGGMATRMVAAGKDVWSNRGLKWLSPADAFVQMERLLRAGVTHAAVMPMDWVRFMAALPTGADHDDFCDVAAAAAPRTASVANAAASPSVAGAWRAAPLNQRRSLVLAHVLKQALNVLGLDSTTAIAPGLPLKEIGLDSLMAVELRNTLTRSIERSLPATLLFDYPSLNALTMYLMRVLQLDEGTLLADASTVPAADIAELSDAEAEAQLLAELEATTQRAML